MGARKAVHPLLLEPIYWRTRLEEARTVRRALMLTPRPDLSGGGRDVTEFRIRAHDGVRLWGLLAWPAWHAGARPAEIRKVGAATPPRIDDELVRSGTAEVLFQAPAGRRLEDRVLDVIRVFQMCAATEGVNPEEIRLRGPLDSREPDEFLIARELFASHMC